MFWKQIKSSVRLLKKRAWKEKSERSHHSYGSCKSLWRLQLRERWAGDQRETKGSRTRYLPAEFCPNMPSCRLTAWTAQLKLCRVDLSGAHHQRWNCVRGWISLKWWEHLLTVVITLDFVQPWQDLQRVWTCKRNTVHACSLYHRVFTSAEGPGTLLWVHAGVALLMHSQLLWLLSLFQPWAHYKPKGKSICIPLCTLTVILWMQHSTVERDRYMEHLEGNNFF